MSVSYEDFVNQYGNQAKVEKTPSYEDFVGQYGAQQQPGFTPEESAYYQKTLNEPEGKPIQPFEEKRIASEMRKKYPELKKYTNQKVVDVYHAIQGHRLRGAGESLAKGTLSALDLPQALASLVTLGKYSPEEYPSQKVQRYLKEKGLDLHSQQSLNPSERLAFKGTEWGGSALGGAGLGKGIVTGAAPLVSATKGIPYLGKTLSGAQKTVGALYGTPSSGKELAQQTALATGLGTAAGGLENLGLSPEQASLIGLAPAASGIARGLIKAPYSKVNPALQGERQAENLFSLEEAARKTATETLGSPSPLPDIEQYGKQLRDAVAQPLKILKAERRAISGPEYQQLKGITERPVLNKTQDYFSSVKEGLDELDPINETIRKTEKLFPGDKHASLTASQVEKKLKLINSERKKAWKSGDYDSYHFYKETLQHLDDDLQKIPEVKKIRKSYAELSKPINEIESDKRVKSILKKKSGEKGYDILDSGVSSKLIDLKEKSLSDQRHIRKIIGNDESVVNQIKAHNFKNLYDSITDLEGNVSRQKLDNYISKNPGIFVWDPSLRNKLSTVDKTVQYLHEVESKIKSQLGNKSSLTDVLKEMTPHGGAGAIAGWALGHSIGGALTGTGIGAAVQGYRHIKQKAFEKHLKALREKQAK